VLSSHKRRESHDFTEEAKRSGRGYSSSSATRKKSWVATTSANQTEGIKKGKRTTQGESEPAKEKKRHIGTPPTITTCPEKEKKRGNNTTFTPLKKAFSW